MSDAVSTNATNQLAVHVVATTFDGTHAALMAAVPLAKGSHARLVVVVPRIMSYAVDPRDASDVGAFFARRYKAIVERLGGDARIEIYVCRTIDDVVTRLIATNSPIVIGGPAGRWLTSPEERFANRLSRMGCRVIFVASGPTATQRRVAPVAAALAAMLSLSIAGPASARPGRPWSGHLRHAALMANFPALPEEQAR